MDTTRHPTPDRPGQPAAWGPRTVGVLALVLGLAAAVPRVANLGELSFYGDEETTSFPARSLATGDGPTMPSGMTYPRALPLTYVNAASARLFGLDEEISYRLPAAIFGALSVPLLFLFGRRVVGDGPALVAATLLAVSEWHLVFSRMARMYVPFLFFFLLAAWAVWRWSKRGDATSFVLAVLATLLATSFHTLGIFVVLLALIPIGLDRDFRAAPWKQVAFVVVAGGASYLLSRGFEVAFGATPPPADAAGAGGAWQLEALGLTAWTAWARLLAGAGLGGWAGVLALRGEEDPGGGDPVRRGGLVVTAAVAGSLLAVGQLYGAGLFLLAFALLCRTPPGRMLAAGWAWLAAAAVLGLAGIGTEAARAGVVEAAKGALAFPFPYPAYLAREFPALAAVFVAVCGWLVLRPGGDEDGGARWAVLAAVLPLVAVGLVRTWGPMRFLWPAYPFFLLVGALGLVRGAGLLADRLGAADLRGRRGALALGAGLALALSGLLAGHGLPSAYGAVTLSHGEPVDPELHQQPFRPDHEAAGEFVRSRTDEGDVVVAEDPLQQRWYAGHVDYWFRGYHDARKFLYVSDGERPRDMYVNSTLIRETATLDSLAGHSPEPVWFITSGETRHARDWYLDEEQRRWLDSLEAAREPVFTARDSVTRVYCLNC